MSKPLTHDELDGLQAHGLHLLEDDPGLKAIFNQMAKRLNCPKKKQGLKGYKCGCVECRAHALKKAHTGNQGAKP